MLALNDQSDPMLSVLKSTRKYFTNIIMQCYNWWCSQRLFLL